LFLALFSGKLRGAFPRDEYYNAAYVHIFDIAGQLKAVIQLDQPVFGMDIDSRTLTMYGARWAPDASLFAFDLRPVLSKLLASEGPP
jgi:hypothetical protein